MLPILGATNVLTPYRPALTLSPRRVSLPIAFGERQKDYVESALMREWSFATIEMVKREAFGMPISC
ncbi:TPA: hypothetical protein EYP44_01855 [Candidatus Bathyarchaeota archaeon]|nr:hypothetical protein [Candidatus Bathyarchaeota archaeon]